MTGFEQMGHIGGLDAGVVDKPLPSAAASGRRKYTEYLERQHVDKAKAVKRKDDTKGAVG